MSIDTKPFIVAELSANHLGSLSRALELVDAAAAAGADAIKVQTWTPGRMVLDRAYVLDQGPWTGRNLAELYEQAHTPWDWHAPLFEQARKHGLVPFASVFDRKALQFLQDIGCPMYKIASFELVDLPLIQAVAATGKQLVISTGMGSVDEIERAVRAAHGAAPGGHSPFLTLLKCTSAYPAPASEANLGAMIRLRAMFECGAVGLSDHTEGIGVAIAAVAIGADMIEKHLTLKRSDGGPDAGFSLEPDEFKAMVLECRRVMGALGEGGIGPTTAEEPQRRLRRSLHWKRGLPAGHVITEADLTTARPATGEDPRHLQELVGWRLPVPVRAGQPVTRRTDTNGGVS